MNRILIPVLPNYLIPQDENGDLLEPIPIESFTDDVLQKVAISWAEELISLAKKRRGINQGSNLKSIDI